MDWIVANKTWLFDGVLVAVPIAVIGWLFARRVIARVQKQRGGHGSPNVQVGGDINVGAVERHDKAGPTKRG
jgi:hypothetical protein